MREIKLTKNQVALVDDADFDWLSQWKWYASWNPNTKSFYADRHTRLPNGKRTTTRMNRLILGLERGDKREGDHKNHNTLDNGRENLRAVTPSENQWNTHGAKGYYWEERFGKFCARIQIRGYKKHLGLFDTPEQAHAAYLNAKTIYHKIDS